MPLTDAHQSQQVTYMLGSRELRVVSDTIHDSDGTPVSLRAKSHQFLLFMLKERRRVVSKAELAEAVWAGLVVTDESISQCATEIRKFLADQDHTILETFPKRGYRLNANAKSHEAVSGTAKATFLFAAVTIIAVGTAWIGTRLAAPPASPVMREVVAVLPFHDTGEAQTNTLADGLAQDLTVRLAELSNVQVLPSSLAFSVNEDGVQALEAAKSLGARFVVDGNLAVDEDKLRVSVELIDGAKGTISWAGSYDGLPGQLVEFRDHIIENIATSINASINAKDLERLRTTGTENPDAYQQIILGRLAVSQFTRETSHQAEKHFRRAIEFDPEHARAYAELAGVYAIRMENGWTVLTLADEEKALFFAKKALELDPDLWLGHYALGRLYSTLRSKDFDKAEHHLERAMALQPANDDARVYYGATKIFQGKAEEAAKITESVVASHPNPPFWYYLTLGNAYLMTGKHEEAERALDQCLQQMPSAPYCLRFQIANFGHMGRTEDAEWLIEEYKILGFTATVPAVMGLLLDEDTDHRAWLKAAFRSAGLPE